MGNIPARCGKCNLVFRAAIAVRNVQNMTLQGNHQQCPRCGGMAKIVEGTFDVSADSIFRQIDGKPVDAELFTRLGIILVQAKLDGAKPSEIVERIGPHSPTLAKRLARVMDDPQASAVVLAALIGAFGMVAAAVLSNREEQPPVEIHIEMSHGELERNRDQLRELRQRRAPLPPWVRNIV